MRRYYISWKGRFARNFSGTGLLGKGESRFLLLSAIPYGAHRSDYPAHHPRYDLFSYRGFQDPLFFEQYLFETDAILVRKEYFRLLSSAFLHGSWLHLILNMAALYSFSFWVGYISWREKATLDQLSKNLWGRS
jgi:hypothetical protein